MTSAQVVETSVTNNSSFQNYTHPDDHTIRTTEKLSLEKTSAILNGVCFRVQHIMSRLAEKILLYAGLFPSKVKLYA